MRLTINLDDDLYALARTHAVATKTSLSKAVGDLLRRRVGVLPTRRNKKAAPAFYVDPVTLLPVVRGNGKPVTNEDVRNAMDDEDLRHIEAANSPNLP